MLFLGLGLLPLAIYLLVLALINRGRRALMVPGTWDFAGVLLGAFGFLAFGGPAILLKINERYHRFLMRGGEVPALAQDEQQFWFIVFLGYYVVVVGLAALLIRRQRRVTAIYNVCPDVFASVLGEVLVERKIRHVQHGNVLYLKQVRETQPPEERNRTAEQLESVLEVEPSTRFQHVTLRWSSGNGALRREIEHELHRELQNVPAPDNPVGDWLLIISGMLFLTLLLGTAALVAIWTLRGS